VIRRKGLSRTTPLRTRSPLERVSRLRSSGPVKVRRRDTGPSRTVRLLVRQRAGGLCEMCRQPGQDVHHRRPRALGGSSDPATNRPSNLIFLCRECHICIEAHRAGFIAAGWLVRQGVDPATVPVWIGGRPVLLDNSGGYTEVGEAA
jgi:5-methylcytosine-specific restriction protein A